GRLRPQRPSQGNQRATSSAQSGQRACRSVRGMAVQPPAVFPGTTEERDALLMAVAAACACRRTEDGRTLVCGGHRMLLNDRVLKHLIFYRRWHAALWPGEANGSET